MLWKIILTPLLLILAFPKFNQSYLAFFSLIPFYFLIIELKSKKQVIWYSFVIGLLINLGFFYWIVPTFQMANISFFVSSVACLAISGYLSVYWSIFGLAIYKYRDRYFLLAAIFVILEYIRTYFFSGFPWNLLGYSQWNNLLFIQSVDIFGVYGISFLVVLTNLFFVGILRKKRVFLILILVALNLAYGVVRFYQKEEPKRTVKVALLQGNIDQYKKFDDAYLEHIRTEYLSLMKENVDVFIWPETAFPYQYPDSLDYFFRGIHVNSYQILGTFVGPFNSAVLIDKDLKEIGSYHKNHLVPFGEVFPYKTFFEKFLPAVKYVGGVSYGKGYFSLKIKEISFGTSICFESLFGNETRKFVLGGANILVNISNDAWYLKTSAPYQHFSFNIFRAIENRRYLARSANTGISAVISPKGEILARTGLYQKDCLVFDVPLEKKMTLYTRFGDWFVWLCFLLIIFKKAIIILKSSRRRKL